VVFEFVTGDRIYSSGTAKCVSVKFDNKDFSRLTIDISAVNGLNDSLGRLAIDLAANTVGGTENLLDGTREVLGERLVSHGAGDLDDLVKGNRLVVLDVLLLLAVTRRLLEGLDDERRSSGDNGDSSLTVLDGELDSYAQAFL
jgi:hypothetical protein